MKNFSKKSIKHIDYRFNFLMQGFNCSMCYWWNTFEGEGCSCPSSDYWFQCYYESNTVDGIQDLLRFSSFTRNKEDQRRKKNRGLSNNSQ